MLRFMFVLAGHFKPRVTFFFLRILWSCSGKNLKTDLSPHHQSSLQQNQTRQLSCLSQQWPSLSLIIRSAFKRLWTSSRTSPKMVSRSPHPLFPLMRPKCQSSLWICRSNSRQQFLAIVICATIKQPVRCFTVALVQCTLCVHGTVMWRAFQDVLVWSKAAVVLKCLFALSLLLFWKQEKGNDVRCGHS